MNFKVKNSAGYTLIEILVAITIVGLLFGVGYANFRGFSQRQAVLNAGKLIQGDLRLAQQMALGGQKPDNVMCDSPNTLNGYNFKVYSTSEYKIEADCSGGSVATKEVTLSPDVLLSTPVPNPISFKVLGNGTNIPSSENAILVLSQVGTGSSFTITLTSGGQIQ